MWSSDWPLIGRKSSLRCSHMVLYHRFMMFNVFQKFQKIWWSAAISFAHFVGLYTFTTNCLLYFHFILYFPECLSTILWERAWSCCPRLCFLLLTGRQHRKKWQPCVCFTGCTASWCSIALLHYLSYCQRRNKYLSINDGFFYEWLVSITAKRWVCTEVLALTDTNPKSLLFLVKFVTWGFSESEHQLHW